MPLVSLSLASSVFSLPHACPCSYKIVSGGGGGNVQDGGQKEARPASNPLWGREKTMVIGQDKISYMALGGDRSPAVLYLPAFDAPAHDYKADSLRS